jgi:hypothetical protein
MIRPMSSLAASGWLLPAPRRAALKGAPLPLRARASGGNRSPYDGRSENHPCGRLEAVESDHVHRK